MTLERSYNGALNVLANYKLFGQALQDLIVGSGWTQTADTGQVTDWTALGAIAASQAAANFMVFRNTSSARRTVYVRIAFWIASGANVSVKVDMGLTTDGAGTITGTVCGNAATFVMPTVTTAGYNRCVGSGDADRFVFMWQDSSAYTGAGLIAIDASRNNSGATTDDFYWMMVQAAGYSWGGLQYADGSLGPSYGGNSTSTPLPFTLRLTSGLSIAYNGSPVISPVCPMHGRIGNPTLNLVVCSPFDAQIDTALDVNLYGTTRRFRAFYGRSFGRGGTSLRCCFLWE